MPNVQLDDSVFKAAQPRAADVGYSTMDECVADGVAHDLVEFTTVTTPNLGALFTPQRLSQVDTAAAEISAGSAYTSDQMREQIKRTRASWVQEHGQL